MRKNLLKIQNRSFSKTESYVPPKPPTMRKVVREKDNYTRGTYEISEVGLKILQQNMSDDKKWFTIYKLPKEHVQSFKSRQVMKYWMQIPPFLLFAKFMASMQFVNGGAAFSLFMTLRYYS
jgi:hypothetical protein